MNYWGLPVAASTYAHNIDFGIKLIHAAMILIFVLWGVFFTYLLIRYRRREGVPAQREAPHGSAFLSLLPDIVIMTFEIGLIAFYAIPVWNRIKRTMPDAKDAFVVEVVAEQFAWNIHYPGPDGKLGRRRAELVHFNNPIGLDRSDPAAVDDIVMGNEMHLPLGKKVLIRLVSKDVIHSFFIPEFRIKQDAVPGMDIPLWVEPNRVGHYEIACAQLCGFGHSLMRGDVYVDQPEDYERWFKSRQAATPVLAKASSPSETW